ncbi:EH domain-containing 3 [Brachionus plicatilis]|uniref:EH domain-containing 3 n=1 Tax=Brachionus plicatilis TaxID=10195 RepID=A0A3M7RIB7_BRAPC|nr:EH domain-containing 3 [Brachionus plicatilis]
MTRKGASNVEDLTMSVNERILRDVHSIYTDPKDGLVTIAKDIGIELIAPRKKINILLIGNHSAGKSSFINWYIEETVQRTGVAIETQGFTLVTSGKKRESLLGNATLHLYPQLKGLSSFQNSLEYLGTEITTSKQKQFSLITFIDTPGLVDGDMKYPFDVNNAILWFGEISDLIFVFFDPIGQALCKRTLNIVEKLNENHGNKINFYLSKSDEAGSDSDRQKVLMQIVQELCKRPGLNKAGFEMLTIYIPTLQEKKTRCVNQIEDVCKQVERTIKQTIQNTLNSLEKDSDLIINRINEKIKLDNKTRSDNLSRSLKSSFFVLSSFILLLSIGIANVPQILLDKYLGNNVASQIKTNIADPYKQFGEFLPNDYRPYFLPILISIALILFFISKLINKKKPTMSKKQLKSLNERREYLQNSIKNKKKKLYDEYLQQSVIDFEHTK